MQASLEELAREKMTCTSLACITAVEAREMQLPFSAKRGLNAILALDPRAQPLGGGGAPNADAPCVPVTLSPAALEERRQAQRDWEEDPGGEQAAARRAAAVAEADRILAAQVSG